MRMIEMFYLYSFNRMIHFYYAKSATFAVFVFGNLGGDDLTGQAENFAQFSIVHFVIQLVVRQLNGQNTKTITLIQQRKPCSDTQMLKAE
jgi:hypothetical protein